MPELKIATFNCEWMVSLFGGLWADWQAPYMPAAFAGRDIGGIKLEPIADVPALCRRIAGVIQDVGAQIVGIQEAPPKKAQMELFVQRYLNDQYVVHYSNARWQTICALVLRSISSSVKAFSSTGAETEQLRAKVPYYPWGKIAAADRQEHRFDRTPLVLSFSSPAGDELRIVVLHAKSKYSKLKKPAQWAAREPEAIFDALNAREKLSAEIRGLRKYLDDKLAPAEDAAIVVMGDMNDGPYAELMEREFLIHNIVDELAGTLLLPRRYFRHAMTPQVLATATSTRFPDPLEDGQIVAELIDHILVSPGLWQASAPLALKSGSCQVESAVYDQYDDSDPSRERSQRPSDHMPVSAVFAY